jgi:DNA end-binding protein Ku
MAIRPIWRGHLRLALVSCPVTLYAVHRASGELHFRYINPKTGNRVRMVVEDADTGQELSRNELVRGYEFEKDRYVTLDEKDFEGTRIESSSVLTIDKFVDAGDIPPIYFDNNYYLAPDGEAGFDVYAVLREAFEKSGKAALSRLVISRREHAVAIMPIAHGMVLHTLHEKRAINDPKELFDPVAHEKADPEMVKLATQLIDRQTAPFEPSDMKDRYEARLREVIEAKLHGQGITPAAPEAPRRDNVIDLMAALKQSLGRGREVSRKTAASRRTKKTRQQKTAAGHRRAARRSA